MQCKLCKKREAVKNEQICDICKLELELSITYHIGGVEVTKEEYNRRINEHFRRL